MDPIEHSDKFCKACLYPLDQIDTGICPECGQSFDPSNESTYRSSNTIKRSRGFRRVLVWSVICYGLLLIFIYWITIQQPFE